MLWYDIVIWRAASIHILLMSLVCVMIVIRIVFVCFFFFQAEDGIRDLVRSRGLGDVYKRQALQRFAERWRLPVANAFRFQDTFDNHHSQYAGDVLSLIHI